VSPCVYRTLVFCLSYFSIYCVVVQKTGLEAQLKASQDAAINVPNLERFIEDMQKRLLDLDFDYKHLNITVWPDVQNVEVTGIIETEISGVRCSSLRDVCLLMRTNI
jgi:hypothetical protein